MDSADQFPSGTAAISRPLYWRLLVEVAIARKWRVRLEQRTATHRTMTRVVQPVALSGGAGGEPGLLLTARVHALSEVVFDLAALDDVALADLHVGADEVQQGEWRVGDAVAHPELGPGVVQSFADNALHPAVLVRFAGGGEARRVRGADLRGLPVP